MLQVDNRTAFKLGFGVFPNEDGVECAYGVIKATFATSGAGDPVLCDEQDDVVLVDEPWADPLTSSLKTAGEMSLVKPGTDVLLRGHAYAPGGRPAKEVDVSVKVGPLSKTVRVFGDRVWQSGVLKSRPSEPTPFETMPLVYERAFGGVDPEPPDPSKTDFEPRNPVGRGLVPHDTRTGPEGRPLPNLEDPAALIRSPKDRPAPAGFGPLAPHWEPRKSYAGTYDEAWTKTRAPYLPRDFDSRFFQAAPTGLIAEGYLKGGELVEIRNATKDGVLAFNLPSCVPRLDFLFDGKEHRPALNLDTVVIDPDAGRLWMIWRACHVVDKKLLRLDLIRAQCPEYPLKKPKGA